MLASTYLADERGAVTVDFTVLTAATVGLGIAAYGVVSGGLGDLTGDIDATLRGYLGGGREMLTLDFTGGLGPFAGGTVRNVPGFGEMLLLDGTNNRGGIGTEATLALDPNSDYAVISFDLAFVDSWDNETGYVFLNGQAVALGTFTHMNHPQLRTGDVPPAMQDLGIVSVDFGEAEQLRGGYFTGSGGAAWSDYRQPVSMVVRTNGASEMKLGFGTNLSSSYTDESLGIDNLSVISTDTAP